MIDSESNKMLDALAVGKIIVLHNFKTVTGPSNVLRIIMQNEAGQILGFSIRPRPTYMLTEVVRSTVQERGDYEISTKCDIQTEYLSMERLKEIFDQDTGQGTSCLILESECRHLIAHFWNADWNSNEYVQSQNGVFYLDSIIQQSVGISYKPGNKRDINYLIFNDPTERKFLIKVKKIPHTDNLYDFCGVHDDGKYYAIINGKNVLFENGRLKTCDDSFTVLPGKIDDEKKRRILQSVVSHINHLMDVSHLSLLAYTSIIDPIVDANADILDKVTETVYRICSAFTLIDYIRKNPLDGDDSLLERIYQIDQGKSLIHVLRADLEICRSEDMMEWEIDRESLRLVDKIENIMNDLSEQSAGDSRAFYKVIHRLAGMISQDAFEDDIDLKAGKMYAGLERRVKSLVTICADFLNEPLYDFIVKHMGRAGNDFLFESLYSCLYEA